MKTRGYLHFLFFLQFIFMCMSVCPHVHMCTTCVLGPLGGQKRTLDFLKQELVVSNMWVFRSSTRAASAVTNWAISPDLAFRFFYFFSSRTLLLDSCTNGILLYIKKSSRKIQLNLR